MFRPLRRKKRELDIEDAKEILRSARRGVLALQGDDGYPYAIPINFWYDEERSRICFHGSREGHKVDSLRRSDKVCLTVMGDEMVRDVAWAPYVRSTVVFGRCHAMGDREDTMAALRRFALKYYPTEQLVDDEIARSASAVQMYEIQIEHMTGKEVQER